MAGSKLGHAPCKTLLLQEVRIFVSFEFHDRDTVTKVGEIWPLSFQGVIAFKNLCLSVFFLNFLCCKKSFLNFVHSVHFMALCEILHVSWHCVKFCSFHSIV